eukprot:877225_1
MGSCLSCCQVDPQDENGNNLAEPFIADNTGTNTTTGAGADTSTENNAIANENANENEEAAPKSRGVTFLPSIVSSSQEFIPHDTSEDYNNRHEHGDDVNVNVNENRGLLLTRSANYHADANGDVVPDESLTDIEKLEKYCPLSTKEERQRFLNAKGGDYVLAYEQLTAYLEWRESHKLDALVVNVNVN